MKALIRNSGETVTEDMHIPGIDWDTGMPLTNPVWAGGPYVLVNDYVPTADEDFAEEPEIVTEPADPQGSAQGCRDVVPRQSEETVTIGGKEYTLEELKKLIED